MITEKQMRLFCVFVRQPFQKFTRKQIKEFANEKSNNALALAINKFRKEGIVKEQKIGKSSLFYLDMESDSVYPYIALASKSMIDKNVRQALGCIKKEIEKHTLFYSMAIFGSYAVQKQKKGSDLDIAIFIETGAQKKFIQAALNNAAQKSLLSLDAHVITKAEFIEMLTNDEENLGKQIGRKHLVVHNHQLFYDLIKEGMKHGFLV